MRRLKGCHFGASDLFERIVAARSRQLRVFAFFSIRDGGLA